MSEVELREHLKTELRWWKWIVGTIIIVVVFLSNMLANKLFYEEDIKNLKQNVERLNNTTETLSYNVILLCEKNGIELKENPLKKK